MLNEFTSWYADRITEMLPGVGRGRPDEGPADALVVDMRATAADGHHGFALIARVRRREKPIGQFTMDQGGLARAKAAASGRSWPAVVVLLPHGTLLERIVTLPLAAEAGLAAVLGYEMDRYTPFSAEEVYWTATVISRDREQARLRVRIALAPRVTLAPVVAMLARLNVAPTVIESAAPDGTVRHLPLHARDEAAGRRARQWLLAGCVCCVLLGAALAAVPFVRQGQQAGEVEGRIAALQPAVAQADALRRQLTAQSAGSDVIAAEELRLGEPLQALSALTQLIPDDTFLTVLTLHERQLGIDGQSASAARLIGLLSADPVIRNAAFAAPVTRTEDGADMFSLKAEVRS